MAAERRTDARFPQVPDARGHYESFYLRAFHPTDPLGVWVRYTVLKRPNARPRGSLWFTLFDGAAGDGPVASKVTLEPGDVDAGDASYLRVGASVFEPGAVIGGTDDARWRLAYEADERALRHLPREWMYRAPVPRTKLLSPYPDARFEGEVEVAGRTVAIDRWRGMVGHNWGVQHAERWIWLHGAGFEGEPDAWLDVAIGRIRLGPATLPWIANGALSIAGERIALGGPGAARRTHVDDRYDGCSFELPGRGLTVRGEAGAPKKDFVAWIYSDPDGGEHNTINCSIARMELTLERAGREPQRLVTPHGAAYELGMRETTHGVPVQPFPDP